MRFSNQYERPQNYQIKIRRKIKHQKRVFNDDILKRTASLPRQNTNDPFANQLFNGLPSFF
jgi:hypothetical protein